MNSIGAKQNTPDMLNFLRAATVLYLRAQRIEMTRATICVLLAGAGAVVAFTIGTAPIVASMGGAWALVMVAGVIPWTRRLKGQAALFQEQFDTELFGLAWNSAVGGAKPTPYDRNRLARRLPASRNGKLRDWYVDTSGIPYPYDVLLCQQQNLGWDARLRRRWAQTIMWLILSWTTAGLTVGYLGELKVSEVLLSWFVPSLGALILGLENYRGQVDLAAERERVTPLVQGALDQAGQPPQAADRLLVTARQVQDVILVTRRQPGWIPGWFYAGFREADEQDFRTSADTIRARFINP
jgi:hypothetical protein